MIEKLYRKEVPSEKVKAVTPHQCNRCNGKNIYQDADGISYCLDCFEYGEINETMTLYRYIRPIPHMRHIISMDYQLTPLQEQASDFLLECYREHQRGFLQAVCGAGKTEMTYQVILAALNEDKKVGFILPRVAVLKEVSKRFRMHFTKTNIATLYEGNKQHQNANLIFSTPQQLIYFYQEFDLLIVDEIDAFPYANNPFLERLLEKSSKQSGIILYMSATMDIAFQKRIENKSIRYHLVPSRYHRKPLVVPECKRIRSKSHQMEVVLDWCRSNRQSLIFVPTIKLGNELYEELQKQGVLCRFVSSESKEKNDFIRAFRNLEFQTLLTTTLLERGVTFADIDCLVFLADHKVFSKETLIQISGRVGRLAEYDSGRIMLLSSYITKAIKEARKEIIRMNQANEMQTL